MASRLASVVAQHGFRRGFRSNSCLGRRRKSVRSYDFGTSMGRSRRSRRVQAFRSAFALPANHVRALRADRALALAERSIPLDACQRCRLCVDGLAAASLGRTSGRNELLVDVRLVGVGVGGGSRRGVTWANVHCADVVRRRRESQRLQQGFAVAARSSAGDRNGT